MWTGDWRDVDNQGQGGPEGARVFAAKIKTKLHKQRAYTLQEGLQDEVQWSQREMVVPTRILPGRFNPFTVVHSFVMDAAPSVLLYTPGIPARHGTERKATGEQGQCSSPSGSWWQMAAPRQAGCCLHLSKGQQGRLCSPILREMAGLHLLLARVRPRQQACC